jgi:methylenetetrahydrofolate dehydrogenase (NADP+)/methenyltetrahydrofolate cyclohydrolase
MQTQIIDGKKIRDEILIQIKKEVSNLPFQPIFCDILIGDDPVSAQYVRMKAKTAESIGIKFHNVHFPESISDSDLVDEIKKINEIPNMCGLIVQLPLPKKFDKQKILDAVSPRIDVDCLNTETSNLFYEGNSLIGFPTALACVHILESVKVNLQNILKESQVGKVVIVGQGILVGKPATYILKKKGYNVDTITRETEDQIKKSLIENADVIISATGGGKIINGDMVKEGVIIIDAGTSESKGGIIGDVDLESVLGKASFVSPVPGGVGPVTVAILLSNVLRVAKTRKE